MTRDQAREKVSAAIKATLPAGWQVVEGEATKHIAVCEALGLIKFDADELDEGKRFVVDMTGTWQTLSRGTLGPAIIEDLAMAGFKIVRT